MLLGLTFYPFGNLDVFKGKSAVSVVPSDLEAFEPAAVGLFLSSRTPRRVEKGRVVISAGWAREG